MKKNISEKNQKGTILIVNNSKSFNASLKKQLLPFGYKVIFSENSLNALDILRNLMIDLIITPLHMNKMDGLEFILNLKDLNIQCPVLVITEEQDENYKDSGIGTWGFCMDPSSKKMVVEITSMLTSGACS